MRSTDIREIVQRSARILGVAIDRGGRGRDCQRDRAARRASPTGCCGACATTRRCERTAGSRQRSTARALQMLEVDAHGFDEVDRRLLLTIIEKFSGGPVGCRQPRRCAQRRARRDRGHLRAISDSSRVSRADAARARGDAARLRVLRPGKGPGRTVVVALRRVRIAGLSTYVPPRVLTNADLEKLVETSDEWILQRTGIRERHIVSDGDGDLRHGEGGVARRDPPGGDHAARCAASSSSARRRRTPSFPAPPACCSTRSARPAPGDSTSAPRAPASPTR